MLEDEAELQPVFDRINASLRRMERALYRCHYSAPASVDIEDGLKFSYCKHNSQWGFYITAVNGEVFPLSGRSLLTRQRAMERIPELIERLSLARNERSAKILALCDRTDVISAELEKRADSGSY